jgi:Tol biopolymer transport system component
VTIAPGQRLGPYEITAKLGEGGMGEVYRATDTKLKRDVAIKVLPAAFTEDKERLDRFEREAQLLAQLHHPNIASIFGMEESDGTKALVMELVEGPTLAERLEQGPLPFNECLSISLQIAHALEEAHEKGIVHRDLKPQNIKASIEGKVKVLDFGLAKAMDPTGAASGGAASASHLAMSPTLTMGATVQGMILGTAAYMSPEQAKGFAVDKRSDIWAFGVVLYEMLVGGSLFSGDSVGDTLAAVIRADIDLDRLPPATPPAVRRLLRRCLERNPKNRLHDIADARIVLEELVQGRAEAASEAAPAPSRRRAPWLPWTIAALAIVAAIAAVSLPSARVETASARRLTRTSIELPATARRAIDFALAPDGGAVAMTLRDEERDPHLWVRGLADPVARLLPGTEGAQGPFWSPDGREIAFFASGRLLRTPREGGAVRTICETPTARGAAWAADGTILFGAGPREALSRVAAAGGKPAPATVLGEGEQSHRFPSFLPDGRHFVFAADGEFERNQHLVKVGSLERVDAGRPLLLADDAARFAAPRTLVFTRGRALLAQEIDLRRHELVGEPRLLAESPTSQEQFTGQPQVDVAGDGAMLYRAPDLRPTDVVWFDRTGRELGSITRLEGSHGSPQVSPDGKRFLLGRLESDGNTAIWVFDLASGRGERVSPSGQMVHQAIWSHDSRELAALVSTAGKTALVWIDAETGRERALLPDLANRWIRPNAVSHDGRALLFTEQRPDGTFDLRYLRLDGERVTEVDYLATGALNVAGVFAPGDGWVAYVSDLPQPGSLWVDRFPAGGEPRRVESGGPVAAGAWSATGAEFVSAVAHGGDFKLVARTASIGTELELGPLRDLFTLPTETTGVDLMPDGERFVVMRRVGRASSSLLRVENWNAGPTAPR